MSQTEKYQTYCPFCDEDIGTHLAIHIRNGHCVRGEAS